MGAERNMPQEVRITTLHLRRLLNAETEAIGLRNRLVLTQLSYARLRWTVRGLLSLALDSQRYNTDATFRQTCDEVDASLKASYSTGELRDAIEAAQQLALDLHL